MVAELVGLFESGSTMPQRGIALPPLTFVVAVPMLCRYPSSHVLKSTPANIVAVALSPKSKMHKLRRTPPSSQACPS